MPPARRRQGACASAPAKSAAREPRPVRAAPRVKASRSARARAWAGKGEDKERMGRGESSEKGVYTSYTREGDEYVDDQCGFRPALCVGGNRPVLLCGYPRRTPRARPVAPLRQREVACVPDLFEHA